MNPKIEKMLEKLSASQSVSHELFTHIGKVEDRIKDLSAFEAFCSGYFSGRLDGMGKGLGIDEAFNIFFETFGEKKCK